MYSSQDRQNQALVFTAHLNIYSIFKYLCCCLTTNKSFVYWKERGSYETQKQHNRLYFSLCAAFIKVLCMDFLRGKKEQVKRCSEKFTKLSVRLLVAVFPIKLYGVCLERTNNLAHFQVVACMLSYIHQNVSMMPDFVTPQL